MNLEEIDYTGYAKLLIESGINLRSGQNLMIRYHVSGSLLARLCAEMAYQHGAGIVDMWPVDHHITRARIAAQAGNEAALGLMEGWIDVWQNTLVDENWAYLALESYEDVGLLRDTDQQSLMFHEKKRREKLSRFRDAVGAHRIPWCVAGVPGPEWARRVLGENRTTAELWNVLKPILLLDQEDPSAAWKAKAEGLLERSNRLNNLKIDTLHFHGGGTDLRVGILPASIWMGGVEATAGQVTLPNIPTEEVFTTPDRLRCEGVVRVTRPVEVRGTMVDGARFTFRDGVLADYSAREGMEALKGYVETDPGATRLGEVALVAEDSPIARSGLNFASILYDENASCHIALGSGYPGCLAGGDNLLTDGDKITAGCNVSMVHLDFMIGSEAVSVTGIDGSGRETPILKDGRFRI